MPSRPAVTLVAWVAGSIFGPRLAAAGSEAIRVEGGLIAGVGGASPEVRVFKGVPFAAPPLGDLRWRPPQPVAPWTGVRRADAFAPSELQIPRAENSITYEQRQTLSEDCLYLNIWTAAASPAERRPVLLYIHGGGFTIGEGTKPGYNGEGLCRKGAVVVTINYRLNIFGFFAHPELSAESGRSVSGNYGLLDMIAAIKWTRRNIAAFGGDPGRITIFGESAGSISVGALATSPLLRGDIRGAIAQSILYVKAPKLADLERKGARFAAAAGAGSIRDLRRMPADRLFKAYVSYGSDVLWWPVVDNWILKGNLLDEEANGNGPEFPVLTGSNADEGIVLNPAEGAAGLADRVRTLYGEREAKAFFRLYPAGSESAAVAAQNLAARDKIAWEHQRWAELRARRGRRTYVYFFTHAPPLPPGVRYYTGDRMLPEHLGAFHTGDIHYIFDSLDHVKRPWKAYDRELADAMSSYWVNFAAKGDPNGPGLPPWPEFGSSAKPVMELGDELRSVPPVLSKSAAEFWSENYARADCVWSLW